MSLSEDKREERIADINLQLEGLIKENVTVRSDNIICFTASRNRVFFNLPRHGKHIAVISPKTVRVREDTTYKEYFERYAKLHKKLLIEVPEVPDSDTCYDRGAGIDIALWVEAGAIIPARDPWEDTRWTSSDSITVSFGSDDE